MGKVRFGRFNRRRLIASSVIAGAASLTAARPLRAQMSPAQPTPLLAQDDPAAVPMLGGNPGRTGEMPGPGPDGSHGVETIWTFDAVQSVRTSPAVANGLVFAGDTNGISGIEGDKGVFYAVDAATGAERWRFTTGSDIHSSPAVVNGAVYFGSLDGYLYALDAEEGTLRWRFPTARHGLKSSPAVVDGVVYFEGGDGNLYAVNAADGAELWRFAYESSQLGFAPAPAVMDGVVYVVEGDGSLSAVNAADGTQHWKIDASMDASFESSPVVANGFVYVAVWRFGRAYLYALDAQSGAERWQYEQVARMKPAVADGVAYIMGQGVLHAFDARSGTERWNHEVTGVSGVDCLLVADGVVYLSFGRTLVAVDAKTRAEIWRHSTESDGTSYDVLPVVINGFVYFNGADGKLHALGAGSAKLSVGGAARVTEATSLRGGPSPTAVERAVLAPDTVVTLTNESKTVGNVVWWPVTVNETGSQGWVDGSKLEPLATG